MQDLSADLPRLSRQEIPKHEENNMTTHRFNISDEMANELVKLGKDASNASAKIDGDISATRQFIGNVALGASTVIQQKEDVIAGLQEEKGQVNDIMARAQQFLGTATTPPVVPPVTPPPAPAAPSVLPPVVPTPSPAPATPAVPQIVIRTVVINTVGAGPLVVEFLPTITGGDGQYGYNWDFGHGSQPSLDSAPTHVFPAPDTYTVSLVVTDSSGNTSQPFQHNFVIGNLPVPTPTPTMPTPVPLPAPQPQGFGAQPRVFKQWLFAIIGAIIGFVVWDITYRYWNLVTPYDGIHFLLYVIWYVVTVGSGFYFGAWLGRDKRANQTA